jgi:hypothetical protein
MLTTPDPPALGRRRRRLAGYWCEATYQLGSKEHGNGYAKRKWSAPGGAVGPNRHLVEDVAVLLGNAGSRGASERLYLRI